MSALPRHTGVVTIAAFIAAFALVNMFAPQWVQAAGFDFWHIDEALADLKQEDLRERELTATQDRLGAQIAANESIAFELIEGRISLAVAVERIAAR